jgi:hypothetical protein
MNPPLVGYYTVPVLSRQLLPKFSIAILGYFNKKQAYTTQSCFAQVPVQVLFPPDATEQRRVILKSTATANI